MIYRHVINYNKIVSLVSCFKKDNLSFKFSRWLAKCNYLYDNNACDIARWYHIEWYVFKVNELIDFVFFFMRIRIPFFDIYTSLYIILSIMEQISFITI